MSSEQPPGATLVDAISAKRQQIRAACESCRVKKIKCDGLQPCGQCAQRSIECVLITQGKETRQQATKRKFDELSHSSDDLLQLYQGLATGGEAAAQELLELIRAGMEPEEVVQHMRHQPSSHRPHANSENFRSFLLALARSTAPLREIVAFAAQVLDAAAVPALPPAEAYHFPHGQVATLDDVAKVTFSRSIASSDSPHEIPVDRPEHASFLHWVPGSFWTEATNDDDVVSHLVSIFLAHTNPYWRLVEEDRLLRSIRACKLSNAYASPFLINSILALASQSSDIAEAFAEPHQYLTRGKKFREEAMRLFHTEAEHPTIANVQALFVLCVDTALCGRDEDGARFLKQATTLMKRIPSPPSPASQGSGNRSDARAWKCLQSTVIWLNLIYFTGRLQGPEFLDIEIDADPELSQYLTTSPVYWIGYDSLIKPIHFNPNRLLLERQRLARFTWDVSHTVLLSNVDLTGLWRSVRATSERFQHWYSTLPEGVSYTKEMPSPLFEFHFNCYCMRLTLYDQAYAKLFHGHHQGQDTPAIRQIMRKTRLSLAFGAASMLSDFRELHGYNKVILFTIQAAAIALGVILRDLHEYPEQRSREWLPEGDLFTRHIRSSDLAFEECFRTLLGTGLQAMLPRAIARSMYQTALKLQIELPNAVKQMLKIVSDSAWRPTDRHALNTKYPNWAMVSGSALGPGEIEMDRVLREWEALSTQDQNLMQQRENGAAQPDGQA